MLVSRTVSQRRLGPDALPDKYRVGKQDNIPESALDKMLLYPRS